jgi:hypothetical protein
MHCPACQLELRVERQGDEVVLSYNFDEWRQRCRHQRGDPVLCALLKPTILELLQGKATPFRSEPRK